MGVLGRQRAGPVAEHDAGVDREPSRDDPARTAGWSGVVFAGLLLAGLFLVDRLPKLSASDAEYADFYGRGGAATVAVVGLHIVPFAGIAGLWHMIATRTLLQVGGPAPGRRSRTGCTWRRA